MENGLALLIISKYRELGHHLDILIYTGVIQVVIMSAQDPLITLETQGYSSINSDDKKSVTFSSPLFSIFLMITAYIGIAYSLIFPWADLGDSDAINYMKWTSGFIGYIANILLFWIAIK